MAWLLKLCCPHNLLYTVPTKSGADYKPKFSVVVVQKRVNARVMSIQQVLDHYNHITICNSCSASRLL